MASHGFTVLEEGKVRFRAGFARKSTHVQSYKAADVLVILFLLNCVQMYADTGFTCLCRLVVCGCLLCCRRKVIIPELCAHRI
jgi:hypothetical protein